MPQCTKDIDYTDFMDPNNVAQLADDTIILAESFILFVKKDYIKSLIF